MCSRPRGWLRHAPGRYSVAKFQALGTYQRTTSTWRAWAVVLLTPAPALVFALLLTLLPLQDPDAGALANWGFGLHFFGVTVSSCVACSLIVYGDAGLTSTEYTWTDLLVSTALASTLNTVLAIALGHLWRFPVPFVLDILVHTLLMFFLLSNAVILLLRRRSRAIRTIRRAVVPILPVFFFQSSQIIIYPAVGALFEAVGDRPRIAVVLLLPVLRLVIRRTTQRMAGHCRHTVENVVGLGTEICAVLFQVTIMQLTPSGQTTAIVLAIEMLQALEAVVVFYRLGTMPVTILSAMTKRRWGLMLNEVVPDATTLNRADDDATALVAAIGAINDQDDNARVVDGSAPSTRPTVIRVRPRPQNGENASIDKQHAALCALRIMHAAETLLLTEYIEVMMPMANVAFLFVASHVDSARYNPRLAPFYHDPSRLARALTSLILYTILQGLSAIVMVGIMRRRFRSSALVHLAFVLEHHRWSIQGRLVVWLIAFLHFSLVHYGVDFTFRFDFAAVQLNAAGGSR